MCRLQSAQREEIFVRELGQLKVPDCLRKLEKVSSVEEDGDSLSTALEDVSSREAGSVWL